MTSADTEFVNIIGASDAAALEGVGKPHSKPMPELLPVLGLSDIVIFPGMVTPLLVESSQSTRLIDDVVAGDRYLALVLQTNTDTETPLPADLNRVGCAGRVLKMLKFPDNSVRVLVEGLRRVRVKEYPVLEPYLCATVEQIPDVVEESVEMTALTRHTHSVFQEVVNLSSSMSDQVKIQVLNTDHPAKLSDLISGNLNLNLQERQGLLETSSVKDRINRLLPLLQRELEVLTLGSKIQREVANAMSKSQRDFYLREQLRVIQRELGENDPAAADIVMLREMIENNGLPEEVKKIATREADRLQSIPFNAAEYSVARNYLDWIVQMPWAKTTEDQLDLEQAARLLNRQHYGLGKVKDRLLEFLAVLKLKNSVKGPILCLVGPPGVGKTSLGKSVADALGRKFIRIALGGMRDEAEIRGHRRTYVSAMPGRIIQNMRRVESSNPVILLDEIDKVGADQRGDPASVLLEVLDPAQNSGFVDNYLDIPFDLSKVLFITTANWLDPIHPALRDRLEVIEIPSYTLEEKIQIARRHLLPRLLADHGLKRKHLKLPAATLRKVIQDYTREAGVRNLEREMANLLRKTARKVVAGGGKPVSVHIAADEVSDYLGAARFLTETAEEIRDCGIAIGLAWTPVGGEILFVEASRVPGKGRLTLTGSLGDVMKESAQAALSYLLSQSQTLKIDPADNEKFDIHLHVPSGATPKDGPSAGITIVVALASLFTRRQVKSGLAMTGEISLRGRVLPVGGVKEKVLAASRSKLNTLILPEDNRKDWLEVPIEVRKRMKAHFVSRISDVFPLALNPAQS